MTLRKVSTAIGLSLVFSLIVAGAPSRTSKTDKESVPAVAARVQTEATASNRGVNHLPESVVEAVPVRSSSAANFEIPWSSINGGGAPSSSTNYSVNASVGQSTIGFATSTNYQAGIGYWYGAVAAGGGCNCPFQSDFDANGFLDAVDLNAQIDALFFGGANPQDPNCPTSRGDFDNSGFPDAVDLNALIDHLFFAGPPPTDPCV